MNLFHFVPQMTDETMDIDSAPTVAPSNQNIHHSIISTHTNQAPHAPTPTIRDNFREIQVKVHVRNPGRDTWSYQGRGVVTQEVSGHSSRVVVRSLTTGKVMTAFGESSDLQAEKRGNFVVIGCVDGNRVISWSLNALNNSETLRLLASIELACYKCKQAVADPRSHSKSRRKIERLIKDDRRKRHRRRKDQEAMIDAFARQNLSPETPQEVGPPQPTS
ncbi:hypothetical protein JR316_0001073 [Psilocybe cubensis]|uniref:Uncharacterized protein n=2 Tax=Psilocybe cubensis TaxID=181762 RepID=A0A8H7YAN2_PSICU|nr:hypothetical protein JR316_0001073 [Psilocybe cubensis]KAH9487007.1 hypothetical protein JR316_0001073 [Psilocybe cubensis]